MKNFDNFIVKDLKINSDKDYLSQEYICYRRIFHYQGTSYLIFTLCLINKNYGIKDWNLELEFEIDDFSTDTDEYVYSETINKFIEKNELEIIITREVEIDNFPIFNNLVNEFDASFRYNDNLAALADFTFINNANLSNKFNPFFGIEDLYLYSIDSDQPQKVFNKYSDSIDLELNLYCNFEDNHIYDDYPNFMKYEIIFALKNQLGEIIGDYCYKGEMFWNDLNFNIEIDLIEDIKRITTKGIYFVEIWFLGYKIGHCEYRLDDYDEIIEEGDSKPHKIINADNDWIPYDMALIFDDLDDLEGLEDIKKEIIKIGDYIEFKRGTKRFFKNETNKLNLHFIFSGNPGTGKTKLALMLGKIFYRLGILSKGQVTVVGRAELIGRYVGETSIKTKKTIENTRGGILFIDEAYSLFKERANFDFGEEAIEILVKEMSDGPGDLIIIAAGYPNEMKIFLQSNPGLASRFKYHFQFPDLTPEELLTIAKSRANRKYFTISDKAVEYLENKIKEAFENKDDNFGNARFINNIIDKAEFNFSSRLLNNDKYGKIIEVALRLDVEDFEGLFENKTQINEYKFEFNEHSFEKAMSELNLLVGIKEVKKEIFELATILKYYREENIDFSKKISLHSIFKGNPGTGKTTVARIIAKIYKSLGLLEKGHLVECDRAGLVGEYIGHTAIKTDKMIQRAMGGVLFIDEAYSLSRDGEKDFGKETIEILIKRMEDHRGGFAVICAGYSEEMDKFLYSNPGLKSRFDRIYEFTDYSESELLEIAKIQFKNIDLKINKVTDELLKIIKTICINRDKYFGNAREIRNVVEKISRKHDLRLAQIPKSKRTDKIKNEISADDLNIDLKSVDKEKPKIGFRIYDD
jgi:SpoVK/Ycf46/Vps4 family AAA+-type ATPase